MLTFKGVTMASELGTLAQQWKCPALVLVHRGLKNPLVTGPILSGAYTLVLPVMRTLLSLPCYAS